MAAVSGIGGERYWVHIPATKPRAYRAGGLVAAAKSVKGSPMANELGDSELVHVNKYEMEQLREMWGEPAINPETGLPAYGLFKTLGKIAKGIVKAAAIVTLTPVLGPVGATMAVNAADTAISGGSFKDVVKSAALSGATAGAGQLGAKFAPDLGISADVGRAVGSGLGTTAGQVATGASLSDALMSGATSGIGTYTTNRLLGNAIANNRLGIGDAYSTLTNLGKDISNATGIGGPAGGYTSRMDIKPVEGAADLRAYGNSATQMTGSNLTGGDIVVTGRGLGLTLGPTFKFNSDTGKIEEEQKYTPPGEEIVVTGGNTGFTVGGIGDLSGGGVDTLNADITQDEDGTILVNGVPAANLNLGATTTDANNDGTVDEKDKEIVVTGTNPAVTVDGTIFNPDTPGVVTPLYPSPPVTATSSGTVPNLVPTGGRYAEVPLNRGLASIGFDPFTYGQGIAGQPGEFLFFTQNGRPYGQVAEYTGPLLNRPAAFVDTQRAAEEDAAAVEEEAATNPPGTNPPVTNPPGTNPPGGTPPGTTTGTRLTLTLPNGPVGGGSPVILEGGNKGIATPENTGYTPAQLTGRQTYYDLMRDPNVAALTGNINKTIASQLNSNKISLEQARGINNQLQALYQSGTANADAIRSMAAGALRDATASYKLASPIATLTAAQNPDSAEYQAGMGVAPGMADGGEVDDDMISHLISYHKNGGHNGPGRVKGIGSGQEDKIPAWLSDGEYVWSAQDVADLGDGSTDEGVRRLDKMRQMVRKQAGRKDVKKIAKPQQGIDRMLKAVGGAV